MTAPTTLNATQEASQSSFFPMHNYTPLVISGNDKNEQLTLLSQFELAFTGKNMEIRRDILKIYI
jgi:hypothetical protein